MDDPDEISGRIIGSAIEVHRLLGPGLLESAYETCLLWELRERGLKVESQVAVPVHYKHLKLDAGYRMDMVVSNRVIVELKAIDTLQPIHTAQALTYLKMTGLKVALILNFNVQLMRSGIKRVVNEF